MHPDLSDVGSIAEEGSFEESYDRMSDAEQVMILHKEVEHRTSSGGELKKLQ